MFLFVVYLQYSKREVPKEAVGKGSVIRNCGQTLEIPVLAPCSHSPMYKNRKNLQGSDKAPMRYNLCPTWAASRFDKAGPAVQKYGVMDRIMEARTHGDLSERDPAVLMVSKVVLSVVEQACEVLNTTRMHATECKDTRTMVRIFDLLDDAEMVFEKMANTWRAGIAVAEAQGKP